MKRIESGTSKEIIFTLTEKSELQFPYYIFELVNDKGETEIFTNNDNSSYKERYNSFTFSVNLNVSELSGGFTASNGQYIYNAWESEYPNNLIIASASGIVETGIIEVYGTSSFILSSKNDDNFGFTY